MIATVSLFFGIISLFLKLHSPRIFLPLRLSVTLPPESVALERLCPYLIVLAVGRASNFASPRMRSFVNALILAL